LQDLLMEFDKYLANQAREKGCPKPDCGGMLHSARYRRKPRGAIFSPQFCVRFSFCCAVDGCRGRVTPESLRFLGPKVYVGVVVVLVAAMRCGETPTRMRMLRDLVGVSRQTAQRWVQWWRETVPETLCWKARSGLLHSPADLLRDFPQSLLERFLGRTTLRRVLLLLRFIAPLTVSFEGVPDM
jgi:hypothetical protein